jgi:hypothetical protein
LPVLWDSVRCADLAGFDTRAAERLVCRGVARDSVRCADLAGFDTRVADRLTRTEFEARVSRAVWRRLSACGALLLGVRALDRLAVRLSLRVSTT